MPIATIPHVKPEDFVRIPKTKSYVSISKTRDYKGETIIGLTGYDEIRMAQAFGLYLTSSAEWGKSRKYFQDNPRKKFHGKTGKEIEDSYTSEAVERTGTLISFRKKGEFPRDVHDLLREAGFDGKIALIDFPNVLDEEDMFYKKDDNNRFRLLDISDKLPLEDGHGQEYDWDLGIFTSVGPEPHSKYHGACQSITPEGTRQLLRNYCDWDISGNERFGVDADSKPSDSDVPYSFVTVRFSSGNKPSEILLDKSRILLARQEIMDVCKKYHISFDELVQKSKE